MSGFKEGLKDFQNMVLALSSEIENAPYIIGGRVYTCSAFGKSSGGSSSGSGSNCNSGSNSGNSGHTTYKTD